MEEKNQTPNQPEELETVAASSPADITEPEAPVLENGVLTDEQNPFFSAPAALELTDEAPAETVEVTETEVVEIPAEIVEVPETVLVADVPMAESEEPAEFVEVSPETEVIPVILTPEEPVQSVDPARNADAFFIPAEDFEDTIPQAMDILPSETDPIFPEEETREPVAADLYEEYVQSEEDPIITDIFAELEAPVEEPLELPQETPDPAPIPRKGRPKRKKGEGLFGLPHLAATLIWLAIIVTIGVTLGKIMWVCAADVLAFGRESKPVSVTIVATDNIDTIAAKLHEAGLVNYPELFKLYVQITDSEEEITTGTFLLNTNYDYHALVNGLAPSSSSRSVVEILIPEGYNCRQIFQLLADNNVCSVAALEDYAANGEFADFWFLQGLERGDRYCLEGYLFPDTYEFYIGSTPREALGKMLIGFDTRFTEEIQSQLPALNEQLSAMMRENGCSEEYIAAHQLTIRDVLIVASLIEEETASVTESPVIASVIYNRLTQDMEYERYLGIDAALIYVTGSASNIDTSMDSPYNTYINAGLTPTPITNPGLASIQAALNPADTDYYYYVLNPETGTHQFSKTREEHEQWIEQFYSEDEEE